MSPAGMCGSSTPPAAALPHTTPAWRACRQTASLFARRARTRAARGCGGNSCTGTLAQSLSDAARAGAAAGLPRVNSWSARNALPDGESKRGMRAERFIFHFIAASPCIQNIQIRPPASRPRVTALLRSSRWHSPRTPPERTRHTPCTGRSRRCRTPRRCTRCTRTRSFGIRARRTGCSPWPRARACRRTRHTHGSSYVCRKVVRH